MPVAIATSAPTTARPSAVQNNHHVGPNTSASPPARKATMITETATQANTEALNIIGKRVTETLDEVGGFAKQLSANE